MIFAHPSPAPCTARSGRPLPRWRIGLRSAALLCALGLLAHAPAGYAGEAETDGEAATETPAAEEAGTAKPEAEAKAEPAAEAKPPATAYDPKSPDAEERRKARQVSARAAVNFLLSELDEEKGIWVTPEIEQKRKVIRWGGEKQVTKEEPVYERVGWKEEYRYVKDPDDPYNKIYKKVRVPVKKKVGTKKVTRTVKTDPVYGAGEDRHYYPRSMEFHNLLPLYALMRVGMTKDAPEVRQVLNWYLPVVDEQGLPDETRTLSVLLLVAMHSGMDGQEELIYDGIGKLLWGQIQEGEANGLWGHYAFPGAYVQKLREEETRLAEAIEKNPRDAALPEQRQQVLNQLGRVCREFLPTRRWLQSRTFKDEILGGRHVWPMPLYDARLERRGNWIDTQWALFALAEAKRLGFLDDYEGARGFQEAKKKRRRRRRKEDKPWVLPKAPAPETVARRTVERLLALQKEDGKYDNARVIVKTPNPYPGPIPKQKRGKVHGWQEKIKVYEVPDYNTELVGTVAALSAWRSAEALLGPGDLDERKELPALEKTKAVFFALLKAYLADDAVIPPSRRHAMPEFFWSTVPRLVNAYGGAAHRLADLAPTFTARMLAAQGLDGAFGRPLGEAEMEEVRPYYVWPLDIQKLWQKEKISDWQYGSRTFMVMRPHQKILASARALLLHAALAAKPLVAVIDLSERGATSAEDVNLEADILAPVLRRTTEPVALARGTLATLTPPEKGGPAVAILRGASRDVDAVEEAAKSLGAYVQGGGTVISISEDSRFQRGLAEVLEKNVAGLEAKEVPKSKQIFYALGFVERKDRDTVQYMLDDRVAAYFYAFDAGRKSRKTNLAETDPQMIANLIYDAAKLKTMRPTELVLGPETWERDFDEFVATHCKLLGIPVPQPEPDPEEEEEGEGAEGKDAAEGDETAATEADGETEKGGKGDATKAQKADTE